MSQGKTPSLFAHFAKLEDFRINRSKEHKLLDIVVIAVCAIICGANDFVGMERFGKAKRPWLEKYLALANGIPSHDTFRRVISRLKPEAFVECFLSWVEALQVAMAGKIVGIDGKTARATMDRAKNKKAVHVVSAWATENHLLLGQVPVAEKSNEITAIPLLLEMIAIAGAIVTIDAMGCQKEIAAKIREAKADYVLSVKGNQEHLEEDIIRHFAARDEGTIAGKTSVFISDKKAHGRDEYRLYEAVPVPPTLRNLDLWKDLRTICRVTSVVTTNGESEAKLETRYFISSLKADAKLLARAVRGHWGIENGLHWVLDVYFNDDRSRARHEHAAANLGLLRRWVLSLLRQDDTLNGSIEKKRLVAGWNDESREKLLGLI
jgi:predicted transposase YbfD/YdcC